MKRSLFILIGGLFLIHSPVSHSKILEGSYVSKLIERSHFSINVIDEKKTGNGLSIYAYKKEFLNTGYSIQSNVKKEYFNVDTGKWYKESTYTPPSFNILTNKSWINKRVYNIKPDKYSAHLYLKDSENEGLKKSITEIDISNLYFGEVFEKYDQKLSVLSNITNKRKKFLSGSKLYIHDDYALKDLYLSSGFGIGKFEYSNKPNLEDFIYNEETESYNIPKFDVNNNMLKEDNGLYRYSIKNNGKAYFELYDYNTQNILEKYESSWKYSSKGNENIIIIEIPEKIKNNLSFSNQNVKADYLFISETKNTDIHMKHRVIKGIIIKEGKLLSRTFFYNEKGYKSISKNITKRGYCNYLSSINYNLRSCN